MRIIFYLFIFSCIAACKSYKTPQESSKRLELSEGGGFTGAYKTYYLLENGQVFFKKDKDTIFQKGKTISKISAENYFSNAEKLFTTAKMVPSTALNYSRSIQWVNKGKTSMIVWSPGDVKYENFDAFYSGTITALEGK